MNKEYIYKEGKVLVIDDKNNQRTVDYYDNLDELLVQENLIEVMEMEIQNLEEEISKFKNETKISRFFWVWSPFLIFTFGPLIFSPIISSLLGVNEIVNTSIFGVIKSGTLLGLINSAGFAIPGALMTLAHHLKEKILEQEQNGKETQLEYLKKELVEQKEYLKKLKLDKANSKETEDFYVSIVDNKEVLKKLKNFLSFYYNLGYNEEKYFKYYQKGKLDSHLEKITNDVGIQFANQHFEKKGPTLVKRKK